MTRVAITGATGAMGASVRETIADRSNVTAALAITRSSTPKLDLPTVPPAETAAGFRDYDIDVVIDFTTPDASLSFVDAATDAGVAAVIGTTGFSDTERSQLEDAADIIPLLVAPNFSRGVAALDAALETVLEQLPGYDIELTETHHNRKQDAPSGTAKRFLETIETARPEATQVHGRVGDAPRSPDEIGVHARRVGEETGEHEIILGGNDEQLRLTHRAGSRRVFAAGAIDAAVWIDGQAPGTYAFHDVLAADP